MMIDGSRRRRRRAKAPSVRDEPWGGFEVEVSD